MTTKTWQKDLSSLPLEKLTLGVFAFVSQMGYETIPRNLFFRVFQVLVDEAPEQFPDMDFVWEGPRDGTYSSALDKALSSLTRDSYLNIPEDYWVSRKIVHLDRDQAERISEDFQSSHGEEILIAVKSLAERFCFLFIAALKYESIQINEWINIKRSAPIGWWISEDLFGEWDDRGVPIEDFQMENYRYFLEHLESLADLRRGLRMLYPFTDDALCVAESMTERRFQAFKRFIPESKEKKRISKDFFTLILPESFMDGLSVVERFLVPLGVALIRIIEIEHKNSAKRV